MSEQTGEAPIAKVGLVKSTVVPVEVPVAPMWPMVIACVVAMAAVGGVGVWVYRWRKRTMDLYLHPRAFASRALAAATVRVTPAR
ncbi:MAG: hypothetical protein NTV94_15760 [Planctomycetota bacterium]|nr:hypothetical protein [Planctomycetota bacterium]